MSNVFGAEQAQANFHGEDTPDPKDVQTLQQHANDPATRANDMLHANPELQYDPIGAHAMLQAPVDDGHTIGKAAQFVNLYGAALKHANDAANSDNPHAQNPVPNMAVIHPNTSWADEFVKATTGPAFNPVHDVEAAWGSTKALGEAAYHGIAGLAQTNEDLQNPGNPQQFEQGLHNVGNALNETANPLVVWHNMSHTAAFFESLVKRKGFAYAVSTMLPYIAAGLITHKVLIGAGLTEAETSTALKAASEEAPSEAAIAARGAGEVAPEATPAAADEWVPKDETPTEVPGKPRSLPFRAASGVANVVTKPLAVAARIVRPILAPSADVRLNAMYYAADAGARRDPETQKLWSDTADGMVVNPDGSKETVGNGLVQLLGLPTGGLSNFISDPATFYAKWIGSDPWGAVGHVVGMTRTFGGTGGVLGKLFGGLGIRNADDVYRVGRQYTRVSRAFQWMADHTSGQIEDTFRGLFFGTAGKEMLNRIGDATTRDEVMKVFADAAQAQGYFHNVAPTLSGYNLMKATFKYGGAEKVVEDALTGTADELHAESSAIEEATGQKVWPPDSANYALAQGQAGARVRERTILADTWQKMFTRRQMYFNEATSKMEDFEIHTGSTGVAHAVGDQLRALGASPTTVSVAEDGILHASEDELNNVVLNTLNETLQRLTYANMKYSVLDAVKVQLDKDRAEFLSKVMGADGAGEKGVMVNGPRGLDYSTSETGGKNMAIGETHLGQLHFARTRDLKNYAEAMAKLSDELSHAQDGMIGLDAHLSLNSLEVKAAFANSTLSGIPERLVGKVANFSDVLSSSAYGTKLNEIITAAREALNKVPEGDTLGHNRAFVAVYDQVRQNLDDTQRTLAALDDFHLRTNIVGTNTAYYQNVLDQLNSTLPAGVPSLETISPEAESRLRGELSALQDSEAEFSAKLQKNAIDLEDIKAHVSERQPEWSDAKVTQLANRIQAARIKNPRYRSIYDQFIDGANYMTSKVFVPLSLFSGGWAIRVGNSEMLLNAFRAGGMKMFQDKLMTSYVKHETGDAAFTSRLEGAGERMLDRLRLNSKDLFDGSMGAMLKRPDLNYAQKLESATLRSVGWLILGMRDAAGGVLHGIEGNVINWTPRTERMFDRVMEGVKEYAPGGLPGGVHSGGGIVSDEAMREHLLYGQEDGGKQVVSSVNENRTFASVDPENRNYYRGLRGSLTRIHDDQFLSPAMGKLDELVGSQDLSKTFSQEQVNGFIDQMTQTSLDNIESKPPSLLARFDRNIVKGKMALSDEQVLAKVGDAQRILALPSDEQQQFFAHYDWARTIALHDFNTVSGITGDGRYIIHETLLRQASTGEVQSIRDIQRFIDSLPDKTEPHGIVAETIGEPGRGHWLKQMMNAPQNIYDAGFRSVLGPMVNSYIRDPMYLSLYDDEMEKLQGMTDRGLIDHESQKLRAHQAAMVKMSKFVHNPMDKELIESNTRAFAPFWFAQNQAWRRWLRVAEENPGAAYKYLRMSLGATNFVAVMGHNLSGEVHIPGTEWIGNLGDMFAKPLGPLGFSLSGSPSSVSSVIPTGAEAGLGVAENIARPSWGPLVTVPLKEVQYHLGLVHLPYANKVIKAILGPIAGNSSLFDEIAPSSFGRNVYNLAQGLFNENNSSFGSAQIWTFNNAVDDKSAQLYAKNAKEIAAIGFTGKEAENITRALTDRQLAEFFNVKNNAAEVHKFMDQVHNAAVAMYAVKTILGFGSPLALTLQDNFSKEPQFQKILNEKNPDGTSKYTYEQAFTEFTTQYPNNIYDLVAHTVPTASNYPETLSALNLIENNPYVIKTYPIAAAYVVKRDEGYDPSAYQLELSSALRQRYPGDQEGVKQYLNALMIANGNDYYYNWLKPRFPDSGTPSQSYKNYEELTKQVTNFGTYINPSWGAYKGSGDGGTYAVEAAAVTQMTKMVDDSNVPASVFGGQDDRLLFKSLITKYNDVVAAHDNAATSKEAYAIESNWYDEMTTLSTEKYANGDLMFPEEAYFMTSVLRYLPKKA